MGIGFVFLIFVVFSFPFFFFSLGWVLKEEHFESKIKDVCQEERRKQWKEHFKNLLGHPPVITDKPIEKIINFKEEEFDLILTKFKIRKATGFDEISPEV